MTAIKPSIKSPSSSVKPVDKPSSSHSPAGSSKESVPPATSIQINQAEANVIKKSWAPKMPSMETVKNVTINSNTFFVFFVMFLEVILLFYTFLVLFNFHNGTLAVAIVLLLFNLVTLFGSMEVIVSPKRNMMLMAGGLSLLDLFICLLLIIFVPVENYSADGASVQGICAFHAVVGFLNILALAHCYLETVIRVRNQPVEITAEQYSVQTINSIPYNSPTSMLRTPSRASPPFKKVRLPNPPSSSSEKTEKTEKTTEKSPERRASPPKMSSAKTSAEASPAPSQNDKRKMQYFVVDNLGQKRQMDV